MVHLGGWPCDMPAIMAYAKEHGLLVIEDCAQAHGASYEGKKVGSFGDAAAFSFCQDKIMSTGGEGGMVVFRDRDHWSRAWSFKDHGRNFEKAHSPDHAPGFRWLNDSFGSNYRMTELQASIGRFQLRKLDEWVLGSNICHLFWTHFDGCPLLRQAIPPENIVHARYRYYTYIKINELNDSYSRDRIIGEFLSMGFRFLRQLF